MDAFAVMAVLNGLIASAYFVMAWYLSPRLGLPIAARFAAVAFFTFCGLTHTELIIHGLQSRPGWLVSDHMFVIHAVQAVVDWGFIVVAVRYLDINFAPKRSRALARMVEAEELSRLGSWEWDLASGRFRGSDGLFRIVGSARTAAQSPQSVLVDTAHPDDRAVVAAKLDAARGGGGEHEFEYRLATPAGVAPRWINARLDSERGRGERPARVIGIVQDVTERRAAETARAELLHAQRAYEREHGIAETLQRSLLPDRLPAIPGVELAATYLPGGPGTEVGGDWYDVIALPAGAIGIAIGDVVGRGIPAAAFVARLRNGLRAYAVDGHPPGEVLRRVNTLITDTRREMSTLFFLVYHPASGELRGANAGHPPAFIRRADGTIERWDAARSMPLGVVSYARYGDDVRKLAKGDAVLVYTDGLVERRGVPLGDALDALETVIPPHGGADHLRTTVLDGMLGAADHDDDIAVFVLAVPDEVEERIHLELPASPDSLSEMRRALSVFMSGNGVPTEIAERAMVAVGEAAGNAVEHAYGPSAATFRVFGAVLDDVLHFEVHDRGAWRPPRGSGRGRGLEIMEAVSDSVEFDRRDSGTAVRLAYALETKVAP